MRNFPVAALRLSLVVAVCSAFPSRTKAQTSAADADRTPVVVELFTSEGCSSCPPADLLLQKLEAEQPAAGAEIIAFEEHVDYWNHDGWVDPYSSPEWTQRQQTYVTLVKNDAYTPELVVDGQSQFVGNNPRQAKLEIEKAARAAKTHVAITAAQSDSKGSLFHVSVGKLVGGTSGDVAEIWLAVTEDGLHSSVSRGENAGHVLQHVATLRSLQKIGVADANAASVSFSGDPVVKFNSHWNIGKLHVTVFVQKQKSREILGAASTAIQETTVDSKRAS
ncbi:MAG TPA: DUF1223 domain-containing protein [Candidatus Eremiobacteraceae bacterium]|nr:DUF1223 domain-containing protein [Candidatus Eremiobacteraceae bacterium]